MSLGVNTCLNANILQENMLFFHPVYLKKKLFLDPIYHGTFFGYPWNQIGVQVPDADAISVSRLHDFIYRAIRKLLCKILQRSKSKPHCL